MQTRPPKRTRHTGRWIFTLLVVTSIVVLAVVIRSFLIDASMTLAGVVAPSSGALTTMIVNQRRYVPPEDSLLTPSQIAFLLQVVQIDDSVRAAGASNGELRDAMAALFNAHVMSVDEYAWITSHTQKTLLTAREFNLISFDDIPDTIRRPFADFMQAESVSATIPERHRIEADRMRISAPLLIRKIHNGVSLFPQIRVRPYGMRRQESGS